MQFDLLLIPKRTHQDKCADLLINIRFSHCDWLFLLKEKESDKATTNTSKRRRRKQRVHEEENVSRLQVWLYFWANVCDIYHFWAVNILVMKWFRVQKMVALARRVFLVVMIAGVVVASAYFGYKGLLWLSDWMNRIETQQRRRYSRVV